MAFFQSKHQPECGASNDVNKFIKQACMMLSQNFLPLRKKWPDLYDYATKAEHYVYSDPHAAVIKLRCYVELLVVELYKELRIYDLDINELYNRLNNASFVKAVPYDVIKKFHAIRKYGNSAAHGKNIPVEHSVRLIKEAYLIGQWFYKALTKDNTEYPKFVQPQITTLNNADGHQTHVDISQATAELASLQKEGAHALAELKRMGLCGDNARLQEFIQDGQRAAAKIDMQSEITAQLFNFEDAFTEYELSVSQKELIRKLDIFLKGKDHNVFLVKGYAGTGKTFITKGLTEYFASIGRNFVLATPTGKAAKVIAKRTGSCAYTIHKTIYSFRDIKEYRIDEILGTETFKYYADLEVNTDSSDTVYIIDEASMISDQYQEAEFFRFGSGYLLKDFFNYVNLDHNDHRKKVIFIGDDAQLPPVGMKMSPALDSEYLQRMYQVNVTEYLLTDVVRQKSGSGVLKNASELRKLLESRVINQLEMQFVSQDVQKIEYDKLVDGYLQACGKKISDDAILIAYSNRDVREYNNCVREYFFPNHPDEIMPGDKIMANNNNSSYGFFISNGDFGIVRNVFGPTESRTVPLKRKNSVTKQAEQIDVILNFRNVEVGFRDPDDNSRFFKAKIIENLLYSDSRELNSDEMKALYVDFCIRNKHLRRNSKEFKDTLRSDPYFNALRLKFGYAITCHKAQGSEWKYVFVKCKTDHSGLNANYVRWLYTAITRTIDTLYLADPPAFKLGSGIRVISSPGAATAASSSTSASTTASVALQTLQEEVASSVARTLESPTKPVVSQQHPFGISPLDTVLLSIFDSVKKCIAGSGIEIADIKHNGYQEAYFFQRGHTENARINIAYKNTGKITFSAPARSDFTNEISLLLASPSGKTATVNSPSPKQFAFSEPFLQAFHIRLAALVDEKKIIIRNAESLKWCQRYTFAREGEEVVFDIWYNGKQQFTKCQPAFSAISFSSLMQEVSLLLTEGLSR